MSAERYVVLHTINGYNYPNFQANLAFGAKYGWDTEDIDTAQVWSSRTLAEKTAEDLNAKIPLGMRSRCTASDFWRVERYEDWANA